VRAHPDATAVEHQPISRAEAEALFEINDAAAERSDNGRFDDLLARRVHHAASVSGCGAVPYRRAVAGNRDRKLAPAKSAGVDTEVLNWIASRCAASAAATHFDVAGRTIVGVAALR